MKHFGIAFGVIIAVAVGGAVVFDRHEAHKTLAVPVAKAQTQVTAPAAIESAPTTLAQAEQPEVGKVELAPAPEPKASATPKRVTTTSARTTHREPMIPAPAVVAPTSATQDSAPAPAVTTTPMVPADTSPQTASPASSPPISSPPASPPSGDQPKSDNQ